MKFEDLAKLDGYTVCTIIQNVTNEDLSLALVGASQEVRSRFYNSMTEVAADMVFADIPSTDIDISLVRAAREKILAVAEEKIAEVAEEYADEDALEGLFDDSEYDEESMYERLSPFGPPEEEMESEAERLDKLPPFNLLKCSPEEMYDFWRGAVMISRIHGTAPLPLIQNKLEDRFSREIVAAYGQDDKAADILFDEVETRLEIMTKAISALRNTVPAQEFIEQCCADFPDISVAVKDCPDKPDCAALSDYLGDCSELVRNILPLFVMAGNEGLLSLDLLHDKVFGFMGYALRLLVDGYEDEKLNKMLETKKQVILHDLGCRLGMLYAALDCVDQKLSPYLLENALGAFMVGDIED